MQRVDQNHPALVRVVLQKISIFAKEIFDNAFSISVSEFWQSLTRNELFMCFTTTRNFQIRTSSHNANIQSQNLNSKISLEKVSSSHLLSHNFQMNTNSHVTLQYIESIK
jgi:hypothetical protein